MIEISIISINLNNKVGLKQSICSYLSQCPSNSELIVIDGESNDGSQEMLKNYNNRIDVIISEKDSGIFDAMNKGIRLAKGRYIYFLNSGDIFSSGNVLLKTCQVIRDSRSIHNIIYGKVEKYKSNELLGYTNAAPWLTHQGAFVKTDIMKKYKFNPSLHVLGDLDLWKRLKKDGQFNYLSVDYVIAKMELDGIGSNPLCFLPKIKDKYYFAKNYGEYIELYSTFVMGILRLAVFKLFGERYYFGKYTNFEIKVRHYLRNIKKQGVIQVSK